VPTETFSQRNMVGMKSLSSGACSRDPVALPTLRTDDIPHCEERYYGSFRRHCEKRSYEAIPHLSGTLNCPASYNARHLLERFGVPRPLHHDVRCSAFDFAP
jgi:hypothetical protein